MMNNFVKACGLSIAVCAIMATACTKQTTQTPPSDIPTAEELVGTWGATADKFELNYGKSALYMMNEDGTDFEYDDEGNYIVITIEEYVNEWCDAYNADPNNEATAVPEEVVLNEYVAEDGAINFGTFTVTENTIEFHQGVKGSFNMDLLSIKGEDYVYDEKTGMISVTNTAIEDDPADIKIQVRKNELGGLTFTYSDFYMYTLWTYENTVEYWPYAPISYICQEGETPDPKVAQAAQTGIRSNVKAGAPVKARMAR